MTRNLKLYHCLTCGDVTRREQDDGVPDCCGTAMVMAGEITVTAHGPRTPCCTDSCSDVEPVEHRRERQHAH